VGARLHLIHPLGFDLSEKAVRRAGLDYWKHVDLIEHESYQAFLKKEKPQNVFYFSAHGEKSVFEADFKKGSYLIFGKESQGLPKEILELEKTFKLPIASEHIRSLNLASSVTAISYLFLQKVPG
jgi:tRNA (cytidine/uridine-2'-O-)-methyltransferase